MAILKYFEQDGLEKQRGGPPHSTHSYAYTVQVLGKVVVEGIPGSLCRMSNCLYVYSFIYGIPSVCLGLTCSHG